MNPPTKEKKTMATKKKTVKKTVAKRAYTRKTPVAKRKYTRKPKNEIAEEVVTTTDQAICDRDADTKTSISDSKENQAENNSSILNQIDVIDLRAANLECRFAVLAMLQKQGYITEQLQHLLSYDMIHSYMFADALLLNHNNKLVEISEWSEASNSYAISRPIANYNAMIGFSKPEAAYEQTLRIGNAQYMRVA